MDERGAFREDNFEKDFEDDDAEYYLHLRELRKKKGKRSK